MTRNPFSELCLVSFGVTIDVHKIAIPIVSLKITQKIRFKPIFLLLKKSGPFCKKVSTVWTFRKSWSWWQRSDYFRIDSSLLLNHNAFPEWSSNWKNWFVGFSSSPFFFESSKVDQFKLVNRLIAILIYFFGIDTLQLIFQFECKFCWIRFPDSLLTLHVIAHSHGVKKKIKPRV